MNKKWFISITAVFILGIGGFFTIQSIRPTQSATEPSEEVRRAIILEEDKLSVEGVIEPVHFATLSAEQGGRITERLVEPGTVVAVGDPLVQLDSGQLIFVVEQAEAGLALAREQLGQSKK